MKATPLLAALLMLGGVSLAYAQGTDDPGASERGSSAQERGNGPDAGASGRPNKSESSGEERRSEKSANTSESKKADRGEGSSTKKAGDEGRQPSGKSADREDSGNKSAKSQKDEGAGSSRMSQEKSRDDKGAETSKQSSSEKMDRNTDESSKGGATQRSAEDNASTGKAKQVDLSGDKRSKVQTAFRDAGNVKHRTNVDISISIGQRLPRDWGFVAVPDSVVAIVPEYRGYRFAYVGDEYVIVEPDTYEVVAVIPAERSTATSGGTAGGQCSEQLSLDRRQRELILDNVRGGAAADIPDLSVGREVPRGVELLRLPSSVTSEVSELEACKYFAAGDSIAIVDPEKEKIVAVIDKKS